VLLFDWVAVVLGAERGGGTGYLSGTVDLENAGID
jgi:hypothetical protein